VPGYLIRSDDGKTILIETGVPRAYVADPAAAAKRDGYDTWLRVEPQQWAPVKRAPAFYD
jgi:hypothetical protein